MIIMHTFLFAVYKFGKNCVGESLVTFISLVGEAELHDVEIYVCKYVYKIVPFAFCKIRNFKGIFILDIL